MPASSQNETDEAMVFSTGDTSMQGTGRVEGNQNLAMASQGSVGVGRLGLHEETKSTGHPGGMSRGNHLVDPRIVP